MPINSYGGCCLSLALILTECDFLDTRLRQNLMCRVTEEESVQPDCCLDLIGYNFIESHVTTMIPGHKKAGS